MEEEKVKIIEIVKVTKKTPIFKDGVEANAIEVINFEFDNGNECGYNVVAQKGLYEIGSQAIYIQPDYCLSDISLFESFTAPGGDPKRSRLGKMNRIRAIKFNFSFENTSDPIYSFGVLLPYNEVRDYLYVSCLEIMDLASMLNVTKYEEPEKAGSGLSKGDFPAFMYKTDETNFMNAISAVKKAITNNETFGLTIKHDGSSHTTYIKKIDEVLKPGVCSRSQEKSLEQVYTNKYVDFDGNEYTRFEDPETRVKGWKSHATQVFIPADEIETKGFKTVTTEVRDSWVDLAYSTGLIPNGLKYCEEHGVELAFRGEIYGSGLKGSGNKLNPDANEKQTLRLFGVDDLSAGYSKRLNYGDIHNLEAVATALGVEYTKPVIIKVTSIEQLQEVCDNIFKSEKEAGRIIEGVVIRSHYTNNISVKYMNPEYDAKK